MPAPIAFPIYWVKAGPVKITTMAIKKLQYHPGLLYLDNIISI